MNIVVQALQFGSLPAYAVKFMKVLPTRQSKFNASVAE